jgi:hypothetical protein
MTDLTNPAAYPVLATRAGDTVLLDRLVGTFRGTPVADGILLSAPVPYRVTAWYLAGFNSAFAQPDRGR